VSEKGKKMGQQRGRLGGRREAMIGKKEGRRKVLILHMEERNGFLSKDAKKGESTVAPKKRSNG